MPSIASPGSPCPCCGATLLCVWIGYRGECLACGARLYATPKPAVRRRKGRTPIGVANPSLLGP